MFYYNLLNRVDQNEQQHISIPPRTGEMYIFPALLQHWVCPFKSDVTRISVSGNVAQINNENNPHDYF